MADREITRRDILRMLGTVTGSALAAPRFLKGRETASSGQNPLGTPPSYEWKEPPRPLTAVVIGAGGRGNVYARYAEDRPGEMRIIGVAEPLKRRHDRMVETHAIPGANSFVTWQHVFDRPRFADICIITTPDHLHYGPAVAALKAGYHLILEKAIAQTWEQCKDILDLATQKDRIVAICHVLRYAPYFRQLRHVVRSGRIGDLVSIQHLEPVEHIHMSHSFVRGNWRNSEESTPMLLSKSCHDLDILRWIIDKPCRKVQSFGTLSLFRHERAPAGAPERCTDGCPAEPGCAFSALRIYLREKLWGTHHLNVEDETDGAILKALKEGPYGRCVYRNDNDVVDHQVVNMEFEDGITASFSMEGLTSYGGRRTRITGTGGDIVGDERILEVFDFSTREKIEWNVRDHIQDLDGHGGGDHRLVRDFIQAVSRQDPSLLTSTLAASMESHLIGFRAEESRRDGGRVVNVTDV